jgi:hypothetical protein
MYGYSVGGGVAARPSGGNPYLAQDLAIREPGAAIIGDMPFTGQSGPQMLLSPSGPGGPVQVSWGGGAVEQPVSNQMSSWRQILDFHNSTAPWILIAVLLVYGYVHISYKRGRAAIGGGFT